MTDRSETRVVLWGRRAAELEHAQALDAEAEEFEKTLKLTRDLAAACRHRAEHLKIAAEAMAALDNKAQD